MTLLHALLRRLRLPAVRSPSRPAMEACEPKLLYSADPLGLYGALAASAEVQTMDAPLVVAPTSAEATSTTSATERIELVVIDGRIADSQALLDDLVARSDTATRFETLVLDRSDDAIARIGQALAGRQDIAALHILSHGAEGQLLLGDRVIDVQTLQQRASELGTWADALASDADILLYGCNVGAGEAGNALVQQLAQLTSADVAASSDDTGSDARGGNWLLEIRSGLVDTAVPFSASLMDSWDASLATFIVTNTLDTGAGSLREAINNANANGVGLDLITFNISGTGIHTITLGSSLSIQGAVSIDATTDDSFAANGSRPAIVINGNNTVQDGFQLYSNSSGSTIRGFVIQNFTQDGIDIASSNSQTIVGNWIGLNSAGTGAAGNQQGVNLWNSNNNIIGGSTAADRNVISANSGQGVYVGGTSTGNQIRGNYIGTNVAGTGAVGNSGQGVLLDATGNTVGGTASGQGNVIAGTLGGNGVTLTTNANGSLVAGNLIGTNAAGTAALPNAGSGLLVMSANNTIGGTTAAARNVIAGNGDAGIKLTGASATDNVVIGNYIGTNAAGTGDLNGASKQDGRSGVVMDNGASNNRIGTNADGSNDVAERNVISGNNWFGVEFLGSGTSGNVVQGNYIGTDATGLVALGNSNGGVSFWNASTNNQLGSGLAGAGNVIAGNETGVLLANAVANNKVQGNLIGLGADGSTVVANTGAGVYVYSGGSGLAVTGNLIGTDGDGSRDAAERNVISGNLNGVVLLETVVSGNTIAGNYIGTDATGSLARGNTFDGVRIEGGATNNTVGGTITARRNVISGNGQDGVQIADEISDGNVVRGNWIGVNAAGTAILGNGGNGIFVSGGADNSLIGGTGANDGNWIAGNGIIGIEVDGASTGTVIQGNRIGTNLDGSADWGHGQNGILLENGASSTLIGGTVAGAGNTIAFNGKGGVWTAGISVTGATSQSNVILGNSITQNVGLGIDLGSSGVTPNDPGDTDTGPNGLLNTLTLTGAVTNGSTLDITGSYGGGANTYYRLEFFSSPTADASGYGEGRTYLGSVNMPIGPTGTISGSYNLAAAVSAGEAISATVTRTDSSYTTFYETSEFANTVTATAVNTAPSDLYMVPGVAESGLIGVYTFSAAGNLGRDDAGGQAPITLYGSPVQTTGPTGSGALDLAGGASGQYGNIAGITTGGAMTIAAQVRFDSTGDWQRVVDFGQVNSTGITAIYVGRLGNSNDLTFTLEKDLGGGSRQTYRATAVGAIVNGAWMHFAATVDGSGAMSIYINGTLAGVGAGVVPEVGVRTNNYIGESNWGADALFDGAIDNLVLARSALTAAQVAALHQQSNAFSVPENAANGTVLGTVLVSDPDAGSSYGYSLVDSAGGRFAIGADGTLTVANGSLLDHESAASHTITVRGTDAGGLWREESFTVAVADINDAPSGSDATLTLAEDSTRIFTLADFGFTDADGDTLLRVWIDTLPDSGSLRWNGATFAAGNWVSATDIAAGQLTYVPQPDAAGTGLASFTFRVQDNGGTAGGGSDTDASANTITLDVTAVNDVPIVTTGGTNLVSNGSFESGSTGWVSNGTIEVNSLLGNYGLVSAADGSFIVEVEGWDVTAQATYIEQTVATVIGQTYTLTWSVATRTNVNTDDMGAISLNGVELDRFTAGADWSDRAVRFTATSTSSTLRFTSLGSQTGETTPNGGGGLLIDDVRLQSVVSPGVSYVEGNPGVVLMPGARVLDQELSDSDNFNGASLTLACNGGASAQDQIAFDGTTVTTSGADVFVSGVQVGSYSFTGGELVVSFGANATQARVNALLQNIVYWNSSDAPPASVQIDWSFSDGNTGAQGPGVALTANGSTTITLTAVNDAPTLSAPGTLAMTEDTAALLGISVGDVDAGSGPVRLTLVTHHGASLNFSGTSGVVWTASTGNGVTYTWTLDGTLAQVQQELTTLQLQPAANFAGSTTVEATFDDLGNTGSGGALTASGSIAVTVAAVNDAPVLGLPGVQVTPANTPLVLSAAQGSAIQLSDVDVGASSVQVGLSVVHGSLTLATTAGLSFSSGDGTADASLVFSGTLAAINAALDGLSYTPTLAYEGGDTLSVSTSDLGNTGSGGALGDSGSLSILVGARRFQEGTDGYTGTQDTYLNDQNPSTAYGNATTVVVDYASPLSPGLIRFDNLFGAGVGQVPLGSTITTATLSVYVTDPDNADIVTLHRMLAAWSEASTHNTLVSGVQFDNIEAASSPSATIDAGISGWVNITGLGADVQAWLNGAANQGWAFKSDGADNWTFVSSEGSTLSQRPYLSISYTPPQAPVVGTSGGSAAYVENGSPVAIDSGLTLSDADSTQLTGATVAITSGFVAGQDVLGFANQSGITGSYNTGTGVLTLSGSASVAQYQAALRSVTYANSSDAPATAPRSIGFSASDAWVSSTVATRSVTVTAVNDAPVLGFVSGSASYTEGSGAVVLAPSATVNDVDSADFAGGVMQVSITANGQAEDRLAIRNQGTGAGQIGIAGANVSYGGTLIGTFSGGTDGSTPLVVSFNANATAAAVQALTRNITYQNVSDAPSTAERTIQGFVTDGDGGTSNAASGTLSIVPVNDAPVNAVPATQIVSTGLSLIFSVAGGNAITVSDIDAGSAPLQVTLSVTHGNLTLSGIGGLSFAAGDGSADTIMSFSGSLAALNTALDGLRYTPDAGYTGLASLQIVSSDLGATGSGGALSDTDGVSINVTDAGLWLSTDKAATSSASAGGATWTDGSVVRFGNPYLQLGAGTTTGTFSQVFDIDTFAADGNANITALHYVRSHVTVGTVNPVALLPGDVLFVVDSNETFAGQAVGKTDVLLFRPASPGDYGAGSFSILLRNPGGTGNEVRSIALVEASLTVGGTALQPGDFLLSLSSASYDKDISLFRPTSIGTNPTGGTLTELIDGQSAGIGFGQQIFGLDLVSRPIVVGGQTFAAGQLLVSLNNSDLVGSNNLSVSAFDIFVLSVTATGTGTSSGTASMLFRGSDVGLSAGGEMIDGLSLTRQTSEAPLLALPGGAAAYVENAAPVRIDASATVSDPDSSHFNGGVLRVELTANADLDDRLAVRDEGSGAGQIGVSGSSLTYGGVVIGSFIGGTDGLSPLTIQLNTQATVAATQALLRNLTYATVSDTPSTLTRTVTIELTDGAGGTSLPMQKSISVSAVNDEPSGIDRTIVMVEDTPHVFSAADFAFTDVDGHALLRVHLDSLPGSGTLRHNGIALGVGDSVTRADILAGLLTYTPAEHASGPAQASFAFRVQDDGGTANGGVDLDATPNTITIDITPVNDAPINSMPGVQVTPVNTPLVLSTAQGRAIQVSDVDAGASSVQVGLSVVHGSLTLATTAGLSFSTGDGTADASLVFSGTLAAINAALDGLSYTPTAGYEGSDTLTVGTSDLGNTGSGGALSDTDVLAIQVGAVSFQQGVAGYSGTEDTFVRQYEAFTAFGNNTTVELNSWGGFAEHGLIRFDNLFGPGLGQIPLGATITSATLSVYVSHPNDTNGGSTVSIYRMLQGWSEGSTWSSMNNGIQTNGTEAAAAASHTLSATQGGWVAFTNLAADLQAWAAGGSNHGWALITDAIDAWNFYSSETGTASLRPYLSIGYAPPQAPVVSTSGGTAAYVENGTPVAIDPGLTLSDADSTQLTGATVAITGGFVAGQDLLGFANQSGITGSYDAGTGVLTLSGSASVA